VAVRWRWDNGQRLFGWRIELQLKVSGRTHHGRALVSETLQCFDPCGIGRHQLRQIQFDRSVRSTPGTRAEEFRNLRDAQTARQPNDPSIGLRNDTDPALHDIYRRKTDATTGSPETNMTSPWSLLFGWCHWMARAISDGPP
jgi:hypothetical protein